MHFLGNICFWGCRIKSIVYNGATPILINTEGNMKNGLFFTTICTGIIACALTANAEKVDSVVVTDIENSVITVSGALENDAEQMMLLFVKDGSSFENGGFYSGEDRYVNMIDIAEDGTFSHSFQYEGSDGEYYVYITDFSGKENALVTPAYGPFYFADYENILAFVDRLADGKNDESYEELGKYAPSAGIELSDFKSDSEKQDYLLSQIFANSSLIKEAESDMGKLDALKRIVSFSGARYDILNAVENSLLTAEINSAIEKYDSDAEFDTAEYFNLKESQKDSVIKALMGKSYTWDEFLKAFNDKVANPGTENNKGNQGSSGNKGGGGSGSSGSGFTAYINNGTLTEKENIENAPIITEFDDLENHTWAKEAIKTLAERGIVSGVGNNSFAPGVYVTREQIAKMIVLSNGSFEEGKTSDFSDVPSTSWSYPYVSSAYRAGIVKGMGNGYFAPDANVKREDAVVMLYRAYSEKFSGYNKENLGKELEEKFIDVSEISDYAAEAVGILCKAGIVNGFEDGSFKPKANMTRAELAKVIFAVLSL